MACIRKRGGRYVLDFYDHQGERWRQTLKKGTTKKRARERLREIEEQVARGLYLPEKRIPTFKRVAKDWLVYKQPNIRPNTWLMYEGHIRLHFEEFNKILVNRITTAGVEKFINDRVNDGMNITTLRKIIVCLNQIMQYAVRHGYILNNPVRDAERPRGKGEIEESKIQILKPPEINSLLGVVKNQKYKTLFMLAIFSGARQGELLGLKWADVDWKNSQIHIQRTYGKGTFYKPKTKTSNRKIDIGPSMMKALKKWRLPCPLNDLDLIFPSEAGNPLAEAPMVRKFFKPALKKAGLSDMRFHDLRHTMASLMIEQGENIVYIQRQLGHSSPTVTLNVYAHLINEVNQEAALRLENTIFSTNRAQNGHRNEKRNFAKSITP